MLYRGMLYRDPLFELDSLLLPDMEELCEL